jgi:hypothetical protein
MIEMTIIHSPSATSSSMVPFTCEKHHGISSGEDRIAIEIERGQKREKKRRESRE